MTEGNDRRTPDEGAKAETRPQQGGEAATTRFGMEEGDNTEPSTVGGPQPDDEDAEDAGDAGDAGDDTSEPIAIGTPPDRAPPRTS